MTDGRWSQQHSDMPLIDMFARMCMCQVMHIARTQHRMRAHRRANTCTYARDTRYPAMTSNNTTTTSVSPITPFHTAAQCTVPPNQHRSHTHSHACTHVPMQPTLQCIRAHTHTHARARTHTHTRTRAHTHTRTHTRAHAHTRMQARLGGIRLKLNKER